MGGEGQLRILPGAFRNEVNGKMSGGRDAAGLKEKRKMEIENIKMAIKHLPPTARKRAERALGLPVHDEEHKIFVYGTLLTGERNAHCAGAARRQRGWTCGTIYDTGYGFPAFVTRGRTHIVGEVLTANDEQFHSMDRLEGYPRLYRREQIQVNLDGGGRVLAWVYIMNDLPKGAKVIESGNWRIRSES